MQRKRGAKSDYFPSEWLEEKVVAVTTIMLWMRDRLNHRSAHQHKYKRVRLKTVAHLNAIIVFSDVFFHGWVCEREEARYRKRSRC